MMYGVMSHKARDMSSRRGFHSKRSGFHTAARKSVKQL